MRLLEFFHIIEQECSGKFVGAKLTPDTIKRITRWMAENNIKNPVPVKDLHVTVICSKDKDFPWNPLEFDPPLEANQNTYRIEKFGDALVLRFSIPELEQRHQAARRTYNIDWDFPTFEPHITLSYDANANPDPKDLIWPRFPIYISHEYEQPYQKINEQDDDREHELALQQTGFWGKAGSGIVPLALSTGRILVQKRGDVEQPGTWGVWGGAIDRGQDPLESAVREFREESGYRGQITDVIPLYVFEDPTSGFQYSNFLALLPNEFEAQRTWETADAEWVEFGEWPTPLHFGFEAVLQDNRSARMLQQYSRRRSIQEQAVDISNVKALYHATHIDNLDSIKQLGVIPMHGEIVQSTETYQQYHEWGEELEEITFFGENPGFINWQVGNYLGKDMHEVTVDDIRNYGVVTILYPWLHKDDIWCAQEDGTAVSLDGENVTYQRPSHVEDPDCFSYEPIMPDVILTGDKLIDFFERVYPQALAWAQGKHPLSKEYEPEPVDPERFGQMRLAFQESIDEVYRVLDAPEFREFEEAEEMWVGGVGSFGDPKAAYYIQQLPEYSTYKSVLQKAVKQHLGDPFRAYRLINKEQLEDWKQGADLPPMSVTTDKHFATAFRKFASHKGADSVVIELSVPAKAVIMRGHEGEQELVIDPNEISFHTVQLSEDASQYLTRGRIPPTMQGLAAEARKAPSYEDFQKDFLGQIKHGMYWHWTNDPNFRIDPEKGPRDMSTMAMSPKERKGKLMITSDLGAWEQYGNRKYVAQIDMSEVPRDKYWQVDRGFGNEFFVDDPSRARVVRVLTPTQAYRVDARHHNLLPSTFEQLQEFYELANSIKEENFMEADRTIHGLSEDEQQRVLYQVVSDVRDLAIKNASWSEHAADISHAFKEGTASAVGMLYTPKTLSDPDVIVDAYEEANYPLPIPWGSKTQAEQYQDWLRRYVLGPDYQPRY